MTEMSAEAVEARRAYQREYRRKNREKINAKRREWRANNKDKVRQCNERYWERIAEKSKNIRASYRNYGITPESLNELMRLCRRNSMDDLIRTVIAQEVGKQLDRQKEELQKALFQGCDRNDTLEKICAMMVINSVYYSVTLAAEVAIGILLELGEFTPHSEQELRQAQKESLIEAFAELGLTGGGARSGNGNVYNVKAMADRRVLFELMIEEGKLQQMSTGSNPFLFGTT